MSQYRIGSTGEVKSQGQIRSMHPNVSLPKVWGVNVHESLGIDPVASTSAPAPSSVYKKISLNGVVQDSDGNWQQAWSEEDMSADERTAYDASVALLERENRDNLLKATDHYGLSDVSMTEAMTTYRQALRDVPQQEGFPQAITWPTKPE